MLIGWKDPNIPSIYLKNKTKKKQTRKQKHLKLSSLVILLVMIGPKI